MQKLKEFIKKSRFAYPLIYFKRSVSPPKFIHPIKNYFFKKKKEQKHIYSKNLNAITICPSYGNRCGISEYVISAVATLDKHEIVKNSLEAISALEISPTINNIILHHEYSFFDSSLKLFSNKESFECCFDNLMQMKKKRPELNISIIVHTCLETYIKYNKLLKKSKDSEIKIFTTSKKGTEILGCKFIPLGAFFNHEIPARPPIDGFFIGNFGMLEGLRNLDDHIHLCKSTNSSMLASHYCKTTEEKNFFDKKIEDSKINAKTYKDFCDTRELLARLSLVDIFYMPRAKSSHCFASASVLLAMQFKKPIIVHPHICYEGLEDALIFTNNVAEAIEEVKKLRDKKYYDQCVAKIEKYLNENQTADVWKKHGVIA